MSNPGWLVDLGADPRLRELGFALLPADEAQARSDALREHYAGSWHLGMLWLDSIWQECRERVASCRVVACGPSRVDDMQQHREALFVRLHDEADELLLAWSSEIPAPLWIPCGRTPSSVAAALGELVPVKRPLRHEFACRTRLFMGYRGQVAVPNPYSGEMVAAGPHDLTRHFNFSPAVGGHYWSSSRDDDPWPDPRDGPLSQVDAIVTQRAVTKQAQGGICSFTRRTYFSGSYLGIELHRGRMWIWNVLHPRSRHPEVIARLNEVHGTKLPTELPCDVVAAMLGFMHMSEAELRRDLAQAEAEDSANVPAYLDVLAALGCMDPQAMAELLRPYLTHSRIDVRGAVANIAAYYGWLWLLEELRLVEPDPELQAWIDHTLPFGWPEEFDERGEPLTDGAASEDDEGTDDDEDDDPEDEA